MKKYYPIAAAVCTVILPFFLIMSAVRIAFTPAFMRYEYNLPDFPSDPYGFSTQDRLKWGNISLEYLLNDSDISFLANQRLDDGTPLYNERELPHMLDVKNVLQGMIRAWWILGALLILCGVWAWRLDHLPRFWKALQHGALLTLGLIAIVLVAVTTRFDALFTAFHRVFFTGDTWLFNYSDTLIRLFPLKLWSDGFTFVGLLTTLGALIVFFVARRLHNR